jgi:hypothetical protein
MADWLRLTILAVCLPLMWRLAKWERRVEMDCRKAERAERRARLMTESDHWPEG